jgi:hypothetical protein
MPAAIAAKIRARARVVRFEATCTRRDGAAIVTSLADVLFAGGWKAGVSRNQGLNCTRYRIGAVRSAQSGSAAGRNSADRGLPMRDPRDASPDDRCSEEYPSCHWRDDSLIATAQHVP